MAPLINITHTLLITGVAIGLVLISNIITRLFVDIERERRVRREVMAYQKALKQAIMSGDESKLAKLKKKEKQMRDLQIKVSFGRMKVMLIFWIPFIAIYYLLINYVGGFDVPVAISPIEIPFITAKVVVGNVTIYTLNLFWWYLISSMAFSTAISKLTGTSIS
ncbi:MAG: EMC3/TMCO1 family protein [Nitrososphaerota archaeon]|nr:EMC3/TMCO1 family protein [Nitrososphaerales archaeon]MCX8191952.1 EMC3/TMCO1 family protein [Nitrososphaerales archaeon]MDW8044279.1 EMC3/TMCO1 family protein [Nitrososphaerota archaeon]